MRNQKVFKGLSSVGPIRSHTPKASAFKRDYGKSLMINSEKNKQIRTQRLKNDNLVLLDRLQTTYFSILYPRKPTIRMKSQVSQTSYLGKIARMHRRRPDEIRGEGYEEFYDEARNYNFIKVMPHKIKMLCAQKMAVERQQARVNKDPNLINFFKTRKTILKRRSTKPKVNCEPSSRSCSRKLTESQTVKEPKSGRKSVHYEKFDTPSRKSSRTNNSRKSPMSPSFKTPKIEIRVG